MTPNQLIKELSNLPSHLKNATIIDMEGDEINFLRRDTSCGPSANKPPKNIKDEKLILESYPIVIPKGKYVVEYDESGPKKGKY